MAQILYIFSKKVDALAHEAHIATIEISNELFFLLNRDKNFPPNCLYFFMLNDLYKLNYAYLQNLLFNFCNYKSIATVN